MPLYGVGVRLVGKACGMFVVSVVMSRAYLVRKLMYRDSKFKECEHARLPKERALSSNLASCALVSDREREVHVHGLVVELVLHGALALVEGSANLVRLGIVGRVRKLRLQLRFEGPAIKQHTRLSALESLKLEVT